MSRPAPPTHQTANWPSHDEALKRRGTLTVWFDPAMSWEVAQTGKRGRRQLYGDAAIRSSLSMTVLFGMALRQTTGFVESFLQLIDLDWRVPDFSTLRRRQKTVAVNIPYRSSNGPQRLPIDSAGIKVEGEGEWNARKHEGSKRRVWRKILLGLDEQMLEVRAIEATTSDTGDVPMPPGRLSLIAPQHELVSAAADGACDTRRCLEAIAARGADAVIPPRRRAQPWKETTPGAAARNEAFRASRRFGRAIWRRWSGYHRRSRAETKMHCVKRLGQRLMARDFDRQVAALPVRTTALNRFTARGIPVTDATG